MANFRQIHVSIWKDPWFMDLGPDQKLLYIYLFSNECTSLSGLYEIPFRVICFETCLETEFVKTSLDYFEEVGKVEYENGVIWVKNLRKYNTSKSETVQIRIKKDIAKVPECHIKQRYISYGQGIDIIFAEEKCNEEKCNEDGMNNKVDPIGVVSTLFEKEIGGLTEMIGEQIQDWVDNYPLSWIEDSIRISSGNNIRRVDYINGILKKKKIEGQGDNHRGGTDTIDPEKQREEDAKRARERIERAETSEQ